MAFPSDGQAAGVYLRAMETGVIGASDVLAPVGSGAALDDFDRAITTLYRAISDRAVPRDRRLTVIEKHLALDS